MVVPFMYLFISVTELGFKIQHCRVGFCFALD